MSDDIVSGNPNIGAASPFLQLARKSLPHINSPLLLIALTLQSVLIAEAETTL